MDLLNASPIELLRSGSRWNWLYHAHISPNTHIWEDPCPAHIIYHTWTHKHILPSATTALCLCHYTLTSGSESNSISTLKRFWRSWGYPELHVTSARFQPYQGCRRYHVSRLQTVRPNYKLQKQICLQTSVFNCHPITKISTLGAGVFLSSWLVGCECPYGSQQTGMKNYSLSIVIVSFGQSHLYEVTTQCEWAKSENPVSRRKNRKKAWAVSGGLTDPPRQRREKRAGRAARGDRRRAVIASSWASLRLVFLFFTWSKNNKPL